MLFKRLGLDLGHWAWPAVACFLAALDIALFLISRAADLLWFPATNYGFFVATLAFLALVWLDGISVRMPRAWLWALVATFLPLIGTIPYARRRCAPGPGVGQDGVPRAGEIA
jgi:hypothetical protein